MDKGDEQMKFVTICLSALPSNPVEREFEAEDIKKARKTELERLIYNGEINLKFMADSQRGMTFDEDTGEFSADKSGDLEWLYDYKLDIETCGDIDTINDHDVFQILEGINTYVVPVEQIKHKEGKSHWNFGSLKYEGDK
jgi:hypothetical protein